MGRKRKTRREWRDEADLPPGASRALDLIATSDEALIELINMGGGELDYVFETDADDADDGFAKPSS